MKTLPKKVNEVLTTAFGSFDLIRVVVEELNIGVTRCYVCGWCEKGFFAAWNEIQYFYKSDIVMFNRCDDAWEYINRSF